MTKKEEAVFVEAFDELEKEGFFDDLRQLAQVRELEKRAQGVIMSTTLNGTTGAPVTESFAKAFIACRQEEPEDSKKLAVIKEVMIATGLGFKEAKNLVDGVSTPLEEDVSEKKGASLVS